MTQSHPTIVQTPDGRELEVVLDGPRDGTPVLYHSGTPSAAASYPLFAREAHARNVRLVGFSRPGYAGSTARPGRTVADVVDDVGVILDNLEVDSFATFGWSGGGPHALACAALMGDRCVAAATIAGVAPYDADGLDWMAGMGQENVEEFGATLAGSGPLTAYLTEAAADLRSVTADDVARSLGDLASPVDVAAVTGELAEHLAETFRRALSRGVDGWRDDDLAFCAPWGFELASIDVPVSVWQGRADRMVPYAHGEWLTAHVAGAQARLFDDEGHLSLAAQVGRVLDDLLERRR